MVGTTGIRSTPAVLVALLFVAVCAGPVWGDGAPLPPPYSRADLLGYVKTLESAERGAWVRAHRLARETGDPLAVKLLKWRDFRRPQTDATFADIARFLEENPDWPSRRILLKNAEMAMGSEISDAEVLAWYRWRDPVSRDGHLRYAEALRKAGKTPRAAHFARIAWVEYGFDSRTLDETHRRFGMLLRTEDHIARLDRLLWGGHARHARRMFRHVDRAYRLLADARLKLRASAGGVDAAIARVPADLQRDPGLLYERLRWRRIHGLHQSARALLLEAPTELGRYPKLWWHERAIQVRRALAENAYREAYRLAAGHRQNATSTFSEAEWLAGWIALRFLGEPERALRHFERLYDAVSMPISVSRAAYWSGRAADTLNYDNAASFWYGVAATHPATFYGQLALARTAAPDAPLIENAAREQDPQGATLGDHELILVVRVLARIGRGDLLGPFFNTLGELARNRTDHALIAALAHAHRLHDHEIRAAQLAARDGYASMPDLFPAVDLPFAYDDGELEHPLVLAVVHRESRFNKKAQSRAGARGLMQLMPGTAKEAARRLHVRYHADRLMKDATYNVALGSTYLRHLIAHYDGSYVLALAAYNGGPGNLARWLEANGDPRDKAEADIVDWIESIPLAETRDYVQRVLEGVQVYRWRLDRHPTASSLPNDLARGRAR